MNKLIKILLSTGIIFLLSFSMFAQDEQDQRLALNYYRQGEYDKAKIYYERIYAVNPKYNNFTYLYDCYVQLEEYKNAEKLTKKFIKKHPKELRALVYLGELYEKQGNQAKAEQQYQKALESINKSTPYAVISGLAIQFEKNGKLEYAIQTFKQGNKYARGNPYMYNRRIATLYNRQGKTELMIETLLNLVDMNEGFLRQTQSGLSNSIDFNEEPKKVELLRKALLKRVQENPNNPIYNELLAWFYTQKGDYKGALIQLKALDQKEKGEGERVFYLAKTCYNNKAYDVAVDAYDYVINLGEDGRFYRAAKSYKLNTLKQKITTGRKYTREEVLVLRKDYEATLKDLGRNVYSLQLIKDLANLDAYYLNDPQTARKLLEEALRFSGLNAKEKAKLKIQLADVLVLLNEVWDASLLYMQVEKEFKEEPLGHEAKFKNARIYYYTGEFEWAKAQLDVLKASTSKLIANDAMNLSLLITANTGMDTTERPMQLFAQADLLIEQHQYDKALQYFDTIHQEFPYHSLEDEILWKKYEIEKKQGNYEAGIPYLEKIITDYNEDILADNALYELGIINETILNNKEKAKEYYKKLLFEYSGSLFLVEARKRYRKLTEQ